jgi:hypothetical protein
MDTLAGSAIHEGLATLLTSFVGTKRKTAPVGDVEHASDAAMEYIDKQVEAAGEDVNHPDVKRQRALTDALIWNWSIVRLPTILEKYEVISSEEEISLPLTPKLELMNRIDVILSRRSDGELSAMDFKCSSYLDDNKLASYQYDLQTILHGHFIRAKYGDCNSVIMEFLNKGSLATLLQVRVQQSTTGIIVVARKEDGVGSVYGRKISLQATSGKPLQLAG